MLLVALAVRTAALLIPATSVAYTATTSTAVATVMYITSLKDDVIDRSYVAVPP
jgi:hypothetical protein